MTQSMKFKKCRSPWLANRYAQKMLSRGWVLAGPISRSGIINKRYTVTLTRETIPPRVD
jgi:hypothetical protein